MDKTSPVDNVSEVRAKSPNVLRMTWTVPGYRAERLLGRGACGEVWAARDDATGEPVALKRLRPGGAARDRERLRSEAALLAAFRHPNVIALRGVLGGADGLVLVLDLATGGSLAQLLSRRHRLRSGQVIGVFAPLADALAAAHGAGLLHGDVSPGNVLLHENGRPLLADLGTARLAGDDAAPAHGTSGYVDPAVRAGAAPTSASDVYSLAAVAVRALIGRAITDGPWTDRAQTLGVPSELVMALSEGLQRDPARRPSAAEFATRLRAAGPTEPVAALFGDVARAEPVRAWLGDAVEEEPVAALFGDAARAEPVASRLGDAAEAEPVSGSATGGVFAADGVFAGPAFDADTRQVPRPPRSVPPVLPRRWWAAPWRTARLAGVPPSARRPGRDAVRRLALVAAVVGLVAVAAAVWVATDPVLEGAPQSSPQGPRTEQEWSGILADLDARREAAFARADVRALDGVYVTGSAPLVADAQAVRVLRAADATAPGVRHVIRRVTVVESSGVRATLEVTDRLGAYRMVGPAGTTVRTVPARGDRTYRLELVRTPAGWRITALHELPARS